MTKQDSFGQRPSTIKGKTLRYNKVTRESRIDDPQAIQFTDLKSGVRPKPFYPDLGGSPKPGELPKPYRMPLQRAPRNSTERKRLHRPLTIAPPGLQIPKNRVLVSHFGDLMRFPEKFSRQESSG